MMPSNLLIQKASTRKEERGTSVSDESRRKTTLRKLEFRYRDKLRTLRRESERVSVKTCDITEERIRYDHKSRLSERNERRKAEKKMRKRVRECIAKMHSMHIHTESLAYNAVETIVESLFNPVKEHVELVKYISSFLILGYQCYRARNHLDVAAAATQYWLTLDLSRDNMKAYVSAFVLVCAASSNVGGKRMLYHLIDDEVCLDPDHWQTESLADKMVSAKNWLTSALRGDAASALRNLFLSAISLKIFEKDFAKDVQLVLGKLPNMTMLELVSHVWDQLTALMRFGENWFGTKSFLSALTAGDPIQTCMSAADTLLYYKDKLAVGLPVSGYKNCKDFINETATLITNFDKVLSRSAPLADLRHVRMRRLDLEQARFDAINLMNASTRPVPMGVIAHGHPGVGKSVILDHICDLWSVVMNRNFDKSHVYSRTMTSQYWERYQPFSQPIVHYSEIGNVTAKMAAIKVDDVIKELTSLVDSLPFPTDQASVDTKGKVFAHPEMVIADTNNPSLNLTSMFSNPTAYQRRFVYVEMKVKPQYRIRGGSGIDPIAASSSTDPSMDRWLFTVTKYIPNGNSQSSCNYLLTDGDIYQFTSVMKSLFLSHIAGQQRVKLVQNTNSVYYLNPVPTVAQTMTSYLNRCKTAYDKVEYNRAKALYDVHFAIHDVSLKDSVWSQYILWRESQGIPTQGFIDKIKNKAKKKKILELDLEEKEDISSLHEESSISDEASIHTVETQFTLYERYRFMKSDLYYWWYNSSSRTLDYITSVPIVIWNVWWWMIFIAGLSLCIWFGEKGWGKEFFVKMGLDALRKKKDQVWNDIQVQLSRRIVNPFETDWWRSYGQGTMIFGLGITMAFTGMKVLSRFSQEKSESESALVDKTEEEILAGTSYARQPIKGMAVWNSRESVTVPGVFRGPAAELYPLIARNIRRVRVEADDNISCFLLGVKGQYAVMNTHCLGTVPNPRLRVSYTGIVSQDNKIFKDTLLDKDNRWDLGNDLTVIRLTDITFRDILKHVSNGPLKGNLKGFFRDRDVSIYCETVSRILKDPIVGDVPTSNLMAYKYEEHKRGMCGMPLLVGDNTICVAGIHVAGSRDLGFSIPLDRKAIECVIERDAGGLLQLSSEGSPLCEGAYIEAHPRSPFAHEFLPGIEYLGRILNKTVSPNQKSRLRKTPMFEEIPEIFEKYGMDQTVHFGKPLMQPRTQNGEFVSPWNLTLNQMNTQRPMLDRKILQKVTDELTERFVSFLRKRDIKLSPLTMDAAIKGAKNDPFIRGVNLSTSAGFGLRGKKRDHILDEGLSPELEEMVDKILENYRSGESASPIYEACLKDEPREISKIKAGKTRVFYSGSTAGLLVSRMLLAPFYSLMVEFNDLFCTTVGINTHRAGELIEVMNCFSPECMAGDYKSYDVSMPFEIGHVVVTIIWNVCKALGYNELALIMLRACLTDNLTPMIEMLGDVFKLPGLQPSGKYATAEDNSLRNLVLLMYGWYSKTNLPFFDYNLPITYGDDVVNAIKAVVKQFWNNQVYQRICKETFGIGYTSPDKRNVMEETTPTLDAEFLKRKFVYRDDIQQWVMPLDHNSLIRALQWVLPSNNVSEQEQQKGALDSIMWELAFHLDEDSHRSMCQDLVDCFNKAYGSIIPVKPLQFDNIIGAVFRDEEFSFPGDDRAGRVDRSDEMIVLESCVVHEDENASCSKAVSGKSAPINRYPNHLETYNANSSDLDNNKVCANEENKLDMVPISNGQAQVIHDTRKQCEQELLRVESSLEELSQYNLPATALKLNRFVENISNASLLGAARQKRALLALRSSLRATIDFLDSLEDDFIQTESALADKKDGAISEIKTEENIMDTAGGEFWMVDSGRSGTSPGTMGDLSLDEFFRRPVEIYTGPVTTSTALVLDVWDTYTKIPSVRAKLRNYSFLRSNLHLRVVISGTPFDYGNVMVSYQPLGTFNINLNKHEANLAASAAWRPLFLNFLSQERSASILSVCENSPLEIKCPFILPKPVARLFNTSSVALGVSDSYADLRDMGQLCVLSMGTIGSTSVGANDPRMQIYAWMEDVELSGPTATLVAITTESGNADERVTGPVEKIASHAQRVSELLGKVPVIGVYAQASSIAFGALAQVAAIMGWSKPLVPDDPTFMRPEPFTNGALTIGRDTNLKLTLDPHQELSVDPRITGTDLDEMSISYLTNKMSYFHSFRWETTDTPMSTILFSARNTPFHDTRGTFGGIATYQPTALKFAAMPFTFWRGDLVYRFKIASNNFFRGKIAIVFEPNVYQSSLILADTALNKQFVRIVDIQDTNTFDVCVNWANAREWLAGYYPTIANIAPWGIDNERCNGFIYVVPFTTLQSPDGTGLDIHMFIGGRNMCFNQLSTEFLPERRITFGEGLRTESGSADVSVAEPVTCMELNESNMSTANIRTLYFGEQPLSFRALLRRYVYNRKLSIGASSGSGRYLHYVNGNYPDNMLPYGSIASVPIDLYSHLKYAYLGMKGSYRHRLYSNVVTSHNPFQVTRVFQFRMNSGNTYTPALTAETGPSLANLNGTATYSHDVNNMVEFEIPLYTSNLFLIACGDSTSYGDDLQSSLYSRSFSCDIDVNDITACSVYEELAAGEDFSFMRFQGAPYYSS